MPDIITILIYLPFTFLTLFVLLTTLQPGNKKLLTKNMRFLSLSLLGWHICNIAYYASASKEATYFLYDAALPFIALMALSLFLFVVRFYGLNNFITPFVVSVFTVIPIFTLVLALTNTKHDFLRAKLEIISTNPIHITYSEFGSWFWLHTAYCYALVLTSFFVVIAQHRRLPKPYRAPSTLLIIAVVLSISGNIINLLISPVDIPVDLSLVGASISCYFLYLSTRKNQGLEQLIIAKKGIFHFLDDAVFILDDEETIVNINKTGLSFLQNIQYNEKPTSFSRIVNHLAAVSQSQQVLEDESNGVDYHCASDVIYNIHEKPIWDKTHHKIGSLVICSNVTENRRLIQTLEEVSGIDTLTGLSNRRSIVNAIAEMDNPENLPITAIVADVNNLKQVNDTFGHQEGDALLRGVAEALATSCPPSAEAGRTGGDEFLVLLPSFSESQAKKLTQNIKKRLKENREHAFPLSAAIGYAVKTDITTDINSIIDKADANMYIDKRK